MSGMRLWMLGMYLQRHRSGSGILILWYVLPVYTISLYIHRVLSFFFWQSGANSSSPSLTTFREREQSLPRTRPKPRVTTDLNIGRPISLYSPSYPKDRAVSARPNSPSPSPSPSTGTRGRGLRPLRLVSSRRLSFGVVYNF